MQALIYVENLDAFREELSLLAGSDFVFVDEQGNASVNGIFHHVCYSKDEQRSIGTASLDADEKLAAIDSLSSAEIIGEIVAGKDDYVFNLGGKEKLESVYPRMPVEIFDEEAGETYTRTPPKFIVKLLGASGSEQ